MLCISDANNEMGKLAYMIRAPEDKAKDANNECFDLKLSELCDVGAGEEENETAKKAPKLIKFVETYIFKN